MKEKFLADPVLPPIIRIVVRIRRGNHTHLDSLRKNILAKHVRAASVIIRRDDQHFLPILPRGQPFDHDQFIERVRRAMSARATLEKRVKAVEEQNATLRAENAELRERLRRSVLAEIHLAETGRVLPP